MLANIVARDPSSTTADNISYISELTKLSPWSFSPARIKAALPSLDVPDKEKWRLGLLTSLLKMRNEQQFNFEETKQMDGMIDSLCNS